jgi:dihydroorotate dehydrogenase
LNEKIALMWYPAIRPALFALDPEKAHRLVLEGLRLAGAGRASSFNASAPSDCMGLRFPNRVGLAAGFAKNATAVDGLGRLGFGFIEVGTVTPRPQRGQGKPRLFRLPAADALVNRLGFPNDGATAVAARLRRRRYRGVVGINIGKNADTPLARAVDDYVSCLRTLRSVANYITINVSSPNTAGLRELQGGDYLRPLLTSLIEERDRGAAIEGRKLPLLVKLSPDLSVAELRSITDLLKALPIDGVVATNTTVGRDGTRSVADGYAGGLSGQPLKSLALDVVTQLRAQLGADFPIIGVGGIDSPEAALAMRNAGADLIQVYTGLVYRGPSLVTQSIRAIG